MSEIEINALIQQGIAAAKSSKQGKKDEGGTKAERHAWKLVGPKTGEPTTQIRGTYTWHWCAKCEHWRTSHDTDGHKGKPGDGDLPAGGSTPSGHLGMIDNMDSSWFGAW
jgi:hypothetical protein